MASPNRLYKILKTDRVVRYRLKWRICNCKYSTSASEVHAASAEDAKNDNNSSLEKVAKRGPPISYLGLGFGDKPRYWRHVLKRLAVERENPPLKKSDFVPASIKLTWNNLPPDIKSKYNEIESYLKEEENTLEKKLDEDPVQYPFQITRNTVDEARNENSGDAPLQGQTKSNIETEKYETDGVGRIRRSSSRQISKKYEEEAKAMYFKHRKFFSCVEKLHKEFDEVDGPESGLENERQRLWELNYGVPDANSSISKIPCGGCGAFLHCTDISIPGYMPSEKFKSLSEGQLRNEQCQRCLYIQHFNVALNVSVSPDEYPRLMSQIKDKNALVVLMVDLLDFPCSIWPGILDIIGPKCPLVVVGNKVDLIPKDRSKYLERIKISLVESLKQVGVDTGRNVKHVELISAKTGYGVEKLITVLQAELVGKDMYLVGCTNVGKSTLFNAFLQSDFCKVRAVDLVQRATTSPWPGTTLNLLKFPILRPTGWRHFLRMQRLASEKRVHEEEERLRIMNFKATGLPQFATLMGRIGMTFYRNEEAEKAMGLPGRKKIKGAKTRYFDPEDPDFAGGHFCYDTPGAIYKDQILDILTAEEILKVLPKQIITPRTFSVRPSQTLFIGGLARIDLLEAGKNALLTVFASDALPIHMIDTADAENFYKCYLGTEMLVIPKGNEQRLKDFPPLMSKEFQVTGSSFLQSSADIILSSVGWVAIAAQNNVQCTLKAYTPEGRGCHLRNPPISSFSVLLKGRRIKGTPAYENRKFSIVM